MPRITQLWLSSDSARNPILLAHLFPLPSPCLPPSGRMQPLHPPPTPRAWGEPPAPMACGGLGGQRVTNRKGRKERGRPALQTLWVFHEVCPVPQLRRKDLFLPTKAKRLLRSSLMAQGVKDPALLLLWLRSMLWRKFNPWPGNFYIPWSQPKKEKEKSMLSLTPYYSWETGLEQLALG